MAGTSKIDRISQTGYMNSGPDTVAGGVSSGLTGAAMFPGQLGDILEVSHTMAAQLSDSAIGTLYGGEYQYVLFLSTGGNSVRGQVMYWSDEANYVVTATAPTSGARRAGIALGVVTAGKYGWIQVTGLASVLFKASITKATPAIDDLVVIDVSAVRGDVIADATAIVSPNLKLVLGVAAEAPVSNSIKKVELWRTFVNR